MERMPALFAGHGSPMNAIEDNPFTRRWEALGTELPRPKAILSVSAHWFTAGTKVADDPAPETIYDMYGFPEALYKIIYNAPGAPLLAREAQMLVGDACKIDNAWGLDHGTWSVLCRMYPKADIPVFQLSVNAHATPQQHFELGRRLRPLREKGVMIFGSGNIVHNLAKVSWGMAGGFPWADEFDAYIKRHILAKNFEKAVQYQQAGASAALSFTTLDHYAPLLYVLGAADEADEITVFNDARTMGSLSMTGYIFS